MTSAAPRGALSGTASTRLNWLLRRRSTDCTRPPRRRLGGASRQPAGEHPRPGPGRRGDHRRPRGSPDRSAGRTASAPRCSLLPSSLFWTVAGGGNIGVALQNAMTLVGRRPRVRRRLTGPVLADPGAAQALGQGLASDLITGLAADATVRAAVGGWISSSLSAAGELPRRVRTPRRSPRQSHCWQTRPPPTASAPLPIRS